MDFTIAAFLWLTTTAGDKFLLPVAAPASTAVHQCTGDIPGALTLDEGRWVLSVSQPDFDKARTCVIQQFKGDAK